MKDKSVGHLFLLSDQRTLFFIGCIRQEKTSIFKTELEYIKSMNNSFIIGRRYLLNSGKDVYFAVSDRYTARGYRYIRFRSDLSGLSHEYKVHQKDGVEFVDIFGGGVKGVSLFDNSVIVATNETEYIALSDKEQRFMNGEEIYVSFEELKRWLNKLPLNSAMGFKIQRDSREMERAL